MNADWWEINDRTWKCSGKPEVLIQQMVQKLTWKSWFANWGTWFFPKAELLRWKIRPLLSCKQHFVLRWIRINISFYFRQIITISYLLIPLAIPRAIQCSRSESHINNIHSDVLHSQVQSYDVRIRNKSTEIMNEKEKKVKEWKRNARK